MSKLFLIDPEFAAVLGASHNCSDAYHAVSTVDQFGKSITLFYRDRSAARRRYLIEQRHWEPGGATGEYVTFRPAIPDLGPAIVDRDQSQFYERLDAASPALRREPLSLVEAIISPDGREDYDIPYQLWTTAPSGVSRDIFLGTRGSNPHGAYRSAVSRLMRDRLEAFVFAHPEGIIHAAGVREPGPYFEAFRRTIDAFLPDVKGG